MSWQSLALGAVIGVVVGVASVVGFLVSAAKVLAESESRMSEESEEYLREQTKEPNV
jgi:uncharacterized membrane-anchored protein YhcB (DUF1043 family)